MTQILRQVQDGQETHYDQDLIIESIQQAIDGKNSLLWDINQKVSVQTQCRTEPHSRIT